MKSVIMKYKKEGMLFMKKFFNKKIEPRCEYCQNGYLSADGKNVLCKRKGVVDRGYSCWHFRYDPLLRVPKISAPVMPQFDPEEFTL